MGRLVDYEEARTEKAKALAAIEVAEHKNSKNLAWSWADAAIDHAVAAGIANAEDLVEGTRYPNCNALKQALELI